MAVDSNNHSPPFLLFPAEIRYKIYTYLFHNIALTISTHPSRKDADERSIPRPEDGFRYTGTSEAVTGILATNHFIRHEAQPIFEKYAWRHLLIKGPEDAAARLPSAWRLGEGVDMPAYHDFNWIMRRRIRRLSTPWLDGLQATEGWYIKRFMPNLESIEIIIKPELLDFSSNLQAGQVFGRLFTPFNQGGGIITSTLPLTAIRLLRTAGNLFNRVRLRTQTVVVCPQSAQHSSSEDTLDQKFHMLLLECVVNPKNFEVVKYNRIDKDKWHSSTGQQHIAGTTSHDTCGCNLDAFAQRYVADSLPKGVPDIELTDSP